MRSGHHQNHQGSYADCLLVAGQTCAKGKNMPKKHVVVGSLAALAVVDVAWALSSGRTGPLVAAVGFAIVAVLVGQRNEYRASLAVGIVGVGIHAFELVLQGVRGLASAGRHSISRQAPFCRSWLHCTAGPLFDSAELEDATYDTGRARRLRGQVLILPGRSLHTSLTPRSVLPLAQEIHGAIQTLEYRRRREEVPVTCRSSVL